jgi:cyclopropane fatty-acyl-phospholipid synthase-like methyltransferase
MKWLDNYLQYRRFKAAEKHIPPKSTLLDIGCNRGEFFVYLSKKQVRGTGLDPLCENPVSELPQNVALIKSNFPAENLAGKKFDTITALAVFEHIPHKEQEIFAKTCHELLCEHGKIIITVPSPLVDYILHTLRFFRLIDAMSLEQHHGFDPRETAPLFKKAGFKLARHRRFEFGLNNLFVFEK